MLLPRFMLTPGRITRFILIFSLLWVVICVLAFQAMVKSSLTDKRQTINSMSTALQARIESYQVASAQLYDVITGSENDTFTAQPLQMVMPGVYQLETGQSKTSLLIFGALSDPSVSHAHEVAVYLNTLWAAKHDIWSMYLLNGQDNSMLMVSTLPLEMQQNSGGRDNPLTTLLDSRRTEMLQQANALDERESYSLLRYERLIGERYFTLRTTFNQPGHLPTVIAFDIPVGDIIPAQLSETSIQLKNASDDGSVVRGTTQLSFVTPDLEISSALASAPLRLVYIIPLFDLLSEALQQLLWPFLFHLLVLILVVYWLLLQRQQIILNGELKPDDTLHADEIAREIVSCLPVGLIVYDFATDSARLINHQAEPLLPHLNLRNIIDIATAHDGGIQVTVNHRNYEVRALISAVVPEQVIFIICDRDREAHISRTLEDAESTLQHSHQIRMQLFRHFAMALDNPVTDMLQLMDSSDAVQHQKAAECARALRQQINDLIMLYQLESGERVVKGELFNLQSLFDSITTTLIPALNRKGLGFFVSNSLPPDTLFYADRMALQKVITTVLHYAVVRTDWGKITLAVNSQTDTTLNIDIIDSSNGLSADETMNIDFPFAHQPSPDRFSQPSALALFLCKHLCRQLNGTLSINNRPGIGTHYQIAVALNAEPSPPQEEKLLEGVAVRLEIATDIIQQIVVHHLQALGATILLPNQSYEQEYDITVSDCLTQREKMLLLLDSSETRCRLIDTECWTVNFNLYDAMQEALLMMIEYQLEQSPSHTTDDTLIINALSEDYRRLFIATVPEDLRKLYTALTEREYDSLSLIAHRLKGVFAMLELLTGQQLCERLEAAIREQEETKVATLIDDVNGYIHTLLQQGSAQ
ncbi:MAG: Phosphotransferase RcsD [Candidatus Erwinia impunctatus]|nr:Phosphotransferase RcsD [Culicoides impunctatus]